MALDYLYQGRQYQQNQNESRYRQTLYGRKNEVDALKSTLVIGTSVQDKGILTSWRVSQKEADIWQIQIEYTVSYDGSSFNNEDSSLIGKKSAQLSVRNLQRPLESHPDYKAHWNHYLFSNNGMAPAWALTATNTIISSASDREHYRWGKSLAQYDSLVQEDESWGIAMQPSKPGVDYYDMAYFVVTISAKYSSASAAGSSLSKNINHILSPSEDFGLGGSWKYDEASVSYDGKRWIATSVYTRSPDQWDSDLYGSSS